MMTETASQTAGSKPEHLSLSIVVPLYNERDNIAPLLESIAAALVAISYPWELILVDDGSADDTLAQAHAGQQRWGGHIRVLAMQRNFGQTAAMQAGIDAARGMVISMLDGDLQNDPRDIPSMVDRLLADDLDMVCGWRRERQDNVLLRTFPSRMANALIGYMTGVRLHDYGCTLKVCRAHVLKRLRLYGEMHRFIPAWASSVTRPERIVEQPVRHHARRFGESKYGLSRTWRVVLDLISVYFFLQFRARPGHFFGRFGLLFGSLGGALLAYLMTLKLLLGEDIGGRPLLLFAVLLVVIGIQFLTTGVLSEILTRVYHDTTGNGSYVLHPGSDAIDVSDHWKTPARQE